MASVGSRSSSETRSHEARARHVGRAHREGAGGAGLLIDDRQFTQEVAGPEARQLLAARNDPRATRHDDVQAVADLTLLDDGLIGGELEFCGRGGQSLDDLTAATRNNGTFSSQARFCWVVSGIGPPASSTSTR